FSANSLSRDSASSNPTSSHIVVTTEIFGNASSPEMLEQLQVLLGCAVHADVCNTMCVQDARESASLCISERVSVSWSESGGCPAHAYASWISSLNALS
ncbi:unnamed protein product, partial [Mycena citricolor]